MIQRVGFRFFFFVISTVFQCSWHCGIPSPSSLEEVPLTPMFGSYAEIASPPPYHLSSYLSLDYVLPPES